MTSEAGPSREARHGDRPLPGRTVLDGAFRVLRALPGVPRHGQVSKLAVATGLPRPTVHRLLLQLQQVGAVERFEGGYRLAPAMADLGLRSEPIGRLRREAMRIMSALRDRTGATVALIVPSESGAIALDVVRGVRRLPVDVYPGQEMPGASAGVAVLDRARATAVDDQALLPDLTCFAVGIDLLDAQRVSLALMTPASDPSWRYERLARLAASRIARSAAGPP